MIAGIHTLDDFNLEGKTILVREDMNCPLVRLTREPRDTTRIRESLPTIREISDRGGKCVILIHQGNDIEYHSFGSTEPHARIVSRLLGKTVGFVDDVCGPAARDKIRGLANGQILMLENVRHMAEEMTLFETKVQLPPADQARTVIVSKLAPLADLYVCDAFAAAHRSQPTLVGFEEVLPSAMGRLMEREICTLEKLVSDPEKPCLFLLGGAKIQDAFLMMSSVLEKGIADLILTSGLVANIMLLAKGVPLGQPSLELIRKQNLESYIEVATKILTLFSERIILPVDLAFAGPAGRQEVEIAHLPSNEALTDIGSATTAEYDRLISSAKTIFFNGPPGVFEKPETDLGTRSVLGSIAESGAFSVIGGGDSIAAVNKFNLGDRISYISTGGGALVRFLSGEELPVIRALKSGASRFPSGAVAGSGAA